MSIAPKAVVTEEQMALLGQLAERLREHGFSNTEAGAEVDNDGKVILFVSGWRRRKRWERSVALAPPPADDALAFEVLAAAVAAAAQQRPSDQKTTNPTTSTRRARRP